MTVSLEAQSAVAILTVGGAGSANRLDLATLDELQDTVLALASDPVIRAVVITGTGATFSLGWDAAVIDELRVTGVGMSSEHGPARILQKIAGSALPLIAAVNGDALSAGLELALACDIRVASRDAAFGFPEIEDGLIPFGGGTQRLPRLVGRGMALEMILGGRPIDATRALDCGLVNTVVEPPGVTDTACALADSIAARGPLAVRLAKEAIHRGADMPLDQALRYETDLTVLLQTTADRAEGVQAFKDRRNPMFHGR